MPNVGDELHHFGWNACASCHGHARPAVSRSFPGWSRAASTSSIRETPAQPKLHKVIEPDEIVRKTKLTAPHTVHCLADGRIMISMLGDDKLQRAGRLPAARREVRDRRPLGSGPAGHELQLRLLVSAAAQRDGQQRVGRPEHDAARLQARRRESRQVRPPRAFLGLVEAQDRQEHRPGRKGHDPARSPLPPQPGQHARLTSARRSRA